MKAIKLPKEIESFLDVAEAAGEETLVFTRKNRPSPLYFRSERWTESHSR
jgi:hypothetical protein